jgi:HK97 family phage major capsid protein
MSENNMTPEQVIEKINDSIAAKTDGFARSEEIDGLKTDLASVKEMIAKGNENDDIDALKSAIAGVEASIDGLKEAKKETPKARSLGEAITNAFVSAKEAILEMSEKGGTVKLDVKAAGTMTIAGNYSGGTVGLSDLETGLTRIQRRAPFMRQLVNTRGTTSKYVVWIEQANADPGVAGQTAEGTEKTQTDFDLVERSSEVKKTTAYIKVSKEMLADIPFMQGEINGELMELVELKLDEQILLGDGTGNNLSGIDSVATAFAAGTFALSVPQANNSDVLRVAISQIANANFSANYILLNPAGAAAMELTKDTNGQYTYPVFVNEAGMSVKGIPVPVIENPGVTAGDFYVGDFTKSNLRIREEMNVQVGYVNDDFTKNLVTILCETRACHFVKTNHFGAFVKGDFATAIAAIDKP